MKEQKWDAKAYARYSKGQEKWAKELLDKVLFQGDEAILDIGCGDGKVTALLATQTNGIVTGIDKSAEMIALASKSYPDVIFLQMDATKLTYEKQFDLIFSNAVLHWVHDHKAVLKGIKKALKTNGKILLQFGGYGNASVILNVAEKMIKDSEYRRFFYDFTFPYYFPGKEEYQKLLEQTGLDRFQASLIKKDMVHENITAFKGWIKTTWFPYTNQLPKDMREKFIDALTQRYLENVPLDKRGRVHVEMVRLEVR